MRSFCLIVCLAASSAAGSPAPVQAADDDAEQAGVEAYFRGRLDEAERHLKVALARAQPNAKDDRARILNTLGGVQVAGDKPAAARDSFKEARDLWLAEDGPESKTVELATHNLAQACAAAGLLAEAERHYAAAWQIRLKVKRADAASRANLLSHLGSLYLSAGRLEDARRCCQAAIDLRLQTGHKDGQLAHDYKTLANTHLRAGDLALAKKAIESACENEFWQPWFRLEWARYHIAAGKPDQAAELLRALRDDAQKGKRALPDSLFVARVLETFAVASVRCEKADEGKKLLTDALAVYEKVLGPSHPELAGALTTYANLFPRDPEAAPKKVRAARIMAEAEKDPVQGYKLAFKGLD